MVLLDYSGIEMKRAFERVTLASVCVAGGAGRNVSRSALVNGSIFCLVVMTGEERYID